jgi:hypothetical protein
VISKSAGLVEGTPCSHSMSCRSSNCTGCRSRPGLVDYWFSFVLMLVFALKMPSTFGVFGALA